jgi:hypothetical protein
VFTRNELHVFAAQMVMDLGNPACDVLGRLRQLLDSVKGEAPVSNYERPEKAIVRDADLFDIPKALGTALAAAKPDTHQFRHGQVPTDWPRLKSMILALPKKDLDKLRLKFLPERLSRQLKRVPTNEEQELSALTMQVLNSVIDLGTGSPSQQDINILMLSIAKLRERVVQYMRSGDHLLDDGEKQAKDVEKVEALLKQLRC